MGNVSTTYVQGRNNSVSISAQQSASAALGATAGAAKKIPIGNDLTGPVDHETAVALCNCNNDLYHASLAAGTTVRVMKHDIAYYSSMSKGEAISALASIIDVAERLQTMALNASDADMDRLSDRIANSSQHGFEPAVLEGMASRASHIEVMSPENLIKKEARAAATSRLREAIIKLSDPTDPNIVRARSDIVKAIEFPAFPAGSQKDAGVLTDTCLVGLSAESEADKDAYAYITGLGVEKSGAPIKVNLGGMSSVRTTEKIDVIKDTVTTITGDSEPASETFCLGQVPVVDTPFVDVELIATEGETTHILGGNMLMIDITGSADHGLGDPIQHARDESNVRVTMDATIDCKGSIRYDLGCIGGDTDGVLFPESFYTNSTDLGYSVFEPLGSSQVMQGTMVVVETARPIDTGRSTLISGKVLCCLRAEGRAKFTGNLPNHDTLSFKNSIENADANEAHEHAAGSARSDATDFVCLKASGTSPDRAVPNDSDVASNRVRHDFEVEWRVRANLIYRADAGVYAFIIPSPGATPFSGVTDTFANTKTMSAESGYKATWPRSSVPASILGYKWNDVNGTLPKPTQRAKVSYYYDFKECRVNCTHRQELMPGSIPPMWKLVQDPVTGINEYQSATFPFAEGETPLRDAFGYSTTDGRLEAAPLLGNINPRYFSSILTQNDWAGFFKWASANGNKTVGYTHDFVHFCNDVLFGASDREALVSSMLKDVELFGRRE